MSPVSSQFARPILEQSCLNHSDGSPDLALEAALVVARRQITASVFEAGETAVSARDPAPGALLRWLDV